MIFKRQLVTVHETKNKELITLDKESDKRGIDIFHAIKRLTNHLYQKITNRFMRTDKRN